MPTTIPRKALQSAQLTVIGGVGLAIVSLGLWIMVFFWILFSYFDSVDWLPTPVNIAVAALAVILPPVAAMTLSAGSSAVVELQDAVEIDGLDSVVGDLQQWDEPADVAVVTQALLRLNDLDLPYSVEVEADDGKSTVTVQLRTEELRWRTLLTRGSQVMRWRLVLTLDARSHRYTFTEISSSSTLVGSGASATLSGAKTWSRGKTMGAGSVTRVWAVGHVDGPQGSGASGSLRIVPSDAKVPVFRIVRSYGWLPKRGGAFWRQWEY